MLHAACESGRLETVGYLVEECGANVNVQSNDKSTPIFVASQSGNLEIVFFLLSAGAKPGVRNNTNTTPLSLATHGGHKGIVSILLPLVPQVLHLVLQQQTLLTFPFLLQGDKECCLRIARQMGRDELVALFEEAFAHDDV